MFGSHHDLTNRENKEDKKSFNCSLWLSGLVETPCLALVPLQRDIHLMSYLLVLSGCLTHPEVLRMHRKLMCRQRSWSPAKCFSCELVQSLSFTDRVAWLSRDRHGSPGCWLTHGHLSIDTGTLGTVSVGWCILTRNGTHPSAAVTSARAEPSLAGPVMH